MSDQIEQADGEPRAHSAARWALPRLSPSMAIRISASLLLIAVSILTNRSFVGWGLFVIFAIMIVPLGRARSFLISFAPYATVWFVFTALRSLSDETILARTLNTKVAELERWLFSGQYPSIMLQDRFFEMGNLRWYDYMFTGVHWSYFIIPHAVSIRVWHKYPGLFRHYLSAMTLLLAVGLCVYFLIPSNPPWLAPEPNNAATDPVVRRIMSDVAKELGGGIYQATYKVIGESNPIAAMPSIHMAITFLIVFPAFHAGKRWGIAALVYSAAMGYSLIYLGEHYFVDVLAGCLITVYGWLAAGTWLRNVAPALARSAVGEGPLAPSPAAPSPTPAPSIGPGAS